MKHILEIILAFLTGLYCCHCAGAVAPLDASSWLADHVIPLVDKYMQLKSVDVPNTRCVLFKLLGYLEPQVLRSHPKIIPKMHL